MKRTLSHILTSEGRVVHDADGDFSHHEYHMKDHLGNTRVVFTEDDGVIKNNDYYPFGMIIGGTDAQPVDGDNKFLYNGKEYINNTDLNLSWYDYGARMYDPQLARWHSIDPLGEEYVSLSSYNYCANNPINIIDPNGLWIVKLNANTDDDGNTTYSIQFIAEENDNLETFSTQSGISMETLSEHYGDMEFKEGDSYSFDKLEEVGRINGALQDTKLEFENCANFAMSCNNIDIKFHHNFDFKNKKGVDTDGLPFGSSVTQEAAYLINNNFTNVNEKDAKTGDLITYNYNTQNEFIKDKISDGAIHYDSNNKVPSHFSIVLLKTKGGNNVQTIIEKPGSLKVSLNNNYFNNKNNAQNGFVPYPQGANKSPYFRKQ